MNWLLFSLALVAVLKTARSEIAISGLSQDVGLTRVEEKALLDEHNALRAKQARGEVPGQPPAADMIRLEWSSATAQHAQTWAGRCGEQEVHGNHDEFGEGQNFAEHGDRNILFKEAFKGWFDDEYAKYKYGSPPGGAPGHYTQIVSAYTHKIGCGAHKCRGYASGRLVCNFFISGNFYEKPPFEEGPACSKCPEGFGYCKDSLCSSKLVCSGDPSCKCTVNERICSQNGQYNAENCECKCNVDFMGLNCDKPCEDLKDQCRQRARDGECRPDHEFFLDTFHNCPASCGKCKAVCKNTLDNCADMKSWGNCKDAPEYMEAFCPVECGMCRRKEH